MALAEEFFDQLAKNERDPRFCKVHGSVEFLIYEDGQLHRWLLSIRHGELRVSRAEGPATTVITLSSEAADAMVRGEFNGLAAIMRGEIMVDGDLGLALRMGRLFPAPAAAHRVEHPGSLGVTR